MANINLLPWRDEYRQEKKREFFSIFMLLCLTGLVLGYIWVGFTKASISNQQERNQILEREIAVLDEKVKEIQQLRKRREELETRIGIIQDLQFRRPLVVRYFDEIVRSVPDGLYFDNLNRQANTFSVNGITESNNRVSTLMRNLDRSDWFQAPNLKNVIEDQFELSVEAISPSEDDKQPGDS
ncbi:MAG: PilN domain-containing protein [Pseudomonadota bacterium]